VARREGEERLLAILDTSDEGVIALDASGRIERLNATACRLLRLPDDEPWLGRQLSELVGGDLRRSGEAELRRPDGTTFPARHRSAAVAAGGGQVVTFRDLTERRALRQMRERFLRVAGHELRTPLTNILGYAEELTEDLADRDPDLRSGADAVLRNARRLQQLTDDMLLLMRLEAGHVPLQPDALDLAELVTRIATGDERVQVAGEAAPAHGDRRLLGRAVRALVRVGLAESGTGGIVLRSSAAGGGAATLALEVPGSRLRPADAERLLEPFGRAETSGAQEGTGLELALAAGVAEVHGGRLAVEAAGSGLVIVLELPRPLSRAG
jgi:signal transduction histidine kinase